jgi:hypothetical protein
MCPARPANASPAKCPRFFSARVLMAVWLVMAAGFEARAADTIRVQLADGFDFPVGKPDAGGYYKSRGFWPNGHLGEDWNGRGGGDSDLGDPIYSIGRGVVVLSEDIKVGWGNCVIVRHAFRDASGKIDMVDSLYGHLQERKVKVHQIVEKGQLVGTMGGNNGMYYVHLHLEVRKNLKIGMNRSQFARDYSNYYSPTQFINANRRLQASFQKFEMPVNTFAAYGKSLADIDASSGPGRGISIPVFPNVAGGTESGSTPAPSGKQDAPATSTTPPTANSKPAPPPAVESGDDFWGRLKSKLKRGKIVEGESPAKR